MSTPASTGRPSPGWQSRRVSHLPPAAIAYVLAFATLSLVAAAAFAERSAGLTADDWIAFAVMSSLAALAQLLVVFGGRNQSYHTALAFVMAGVILLPPELLLPLAIVQHLPDWVRHRYPWYIQTFNIANFTLNALAAWSVARAFGHWDAPSRDLDYALAGLAASVVFIAANHAFLAVMLRLGRGHSVRSSGLFTPASLGGDLLLASLGVAMAFVYRENPWLVLALLAPLAASHRTYRVIAALRASEERFSALFDTAAVAATIVGLDGRIQHANRFMEEILEYGPGELVGVELATLQHPDDATGGELFVELARGERSSYRLERRFVGRDGRVVWADVSVALVRTAQGRPDFAVAIGVDVTERRELEDALRQAQKMEAVGQLAGGIAHDFNNVLTAISGYAELAALHVGDDELLREDVHEIERAAGRAAALTRQLLAFSRKQIMRPERLDLNEAVRELEPMLTRLIGDSVHISLRLASPVLAVSADRGQLHQVIVNLVVNARDAMMPEGGTITIGTEGVVLDGDSNERSGVIEPGGYAKLTVGDTGRGIDEDTMQRIFEPFFTTKEPGKGTGLGLSTVYGIVKQSGGYVAADSEPGQGAEFSVYLPAVEALAPEEELAAPAGGRERGTETVLLVEDEDVVRALVQQVLEPRGYEVLAAGDGEEALALAGEHEGRIDLLLTDVMMPNLTGREVADRLRTERPDVKVLYMTGYADASLVGDDVLERETALIEKPFTFAALTDAVRSALDD